MYCGSNKTALSSQKQIAEALLRLMADHPYADISVSSLCREAGISRQTFYSLFTSRENVVVYTLQEKYGYTPEQPEEEEDCSALHRLCRGYGNYIVNNRSFLQVLVDNGIDYLLYDSIADALSSCSCFMPDLPDERRQFAADYYAGGITGVAKRYARLGCRITEAELEDILYQLLSGSLFS